MKHIKKICDDLQATKSYNKKREILKKNVKDTRWNDILYYLYSPGITTGLGENKIYDWYNVSPEPMEFCTGHGGDLIEHFTYFATGTKKDIGYMWRAINRQPPELEEFLLSIMLRTIKLGIDAAQINRAYGYDFLPVVKVKQPVDYFMYCDKIGNAKFTVNPVIDGIRGIIRCDRYDRTTRQIAKTSEFIYGIDHILREVEQMGRDQFILDGYFIYNGKEEMTSEELYKKSQQAVSKIIDQRELYFCAIDMLSTLEYDHHTCSTPFAERFDSLVHLVSGRFENLKVVPTFYAGRGKKILEKLFKEHIKRGGTGLTVSLDDGLYKYGGTSRNYLKLITVKTAFLLIVDYGLSLNDDGKRVLDYIGVEYKGVTQKIILGFSAEQRENYAARAHLLIGRVAIIQFSKENIGEDGQARMITPVFLEMAEPGTKIKYEDT